MKTPTVRVCTTVHQTTSKEKSFALRHQTNERTSGGGRASHSTHSVLEAAIRGCIWGYWRLDNHVFVNVNGNPCYVDHRM